jgi:hypothetical protein
MPPVQQQHCVHSLFRCCALPVLLPEADVEQQQQQSARKRVIGYYEAELPPELPLPEGAYASPEQQQQLARLKVRLHGWTVRAHACNSSNSRSWHDSR